VIEPLGDEALLIVLGERIDPALSDRAHALAARLAAPGDHASGISWGVPIPGYASVLVPYEAPGQPLEAVIGALREALDGASAEPSGTPDTTDRAADTVVEIPVRYGGADGPDLDAVAERVRLSSSQVVEAHAGTTYRVYLLGFAPGFAYMGDLPPELDVPRREEPRPRVPAGSVAVAGRQTTVYPSETAGGWHLIGRTDAAVWDPFRDPPALFAPGRRVRFVPTSG
jgi:KipI family sensor histidine kinase inhibitor